MREFETLALMTILVGFLPALGTRLVWIIALTFVAALVIWQGTMSCLEETDGMEGIACIFGSIIGGTLAVASLCVGLVRMRYRVRGAETLLGRPWVAALAIYATAIVGFVLFVYWMTID